jgi:hypothetical protein
MGVRNLFLFLSLLEDPVPKDDKNHQGHSENDHGLIILCKDMLISNMNQDLVRRI